MITKYRIATALTAAMMIGCAPAASAFETEASHAVIMDHDSGIVLFSKNADQPMIPASMTKMMTAYMVFERLADGRLSPDDEFSVSENAWRKGGTTSGGSTMFLEPNSKVSVANLLRGIIVVSGNDACIVVAENISGSEEAFADEMTQTARRLGLTSASFRNATGLNEDGHEISAADLAELARLTIQNFPELYEIYDIPEFEWNGIRQPNRNPLLRRFEGADGLKTGHLSASGYGLVGSAVVDGKRRIIVINGTESETARANVSERIMRSAFREFAVATPVSPGVELARAPVWLGKADSVGLAVSEEIQFGYEISDKARIKGEIILKDGLVAPVDEGTQVGTFVLTSGEGLRQEVPVVTTESVGRIGFLSQAFEGLATVLNPSQTPETASSDS